MSEAGIQLSASSEDLRRLASEYNWDDGFAFPCHIADHPNCDLAAALELFWLANADAVYLGEAQDSPHNAAWRSFSEILAKRIIDGFYSPGPGTFDPPLTKVQAYNLRKRGLPEIFLASVIGGRA
ncbi:DUF4274 domain-containing protein [Lysobacter sp. Root916]|uniref:DUF4274 domain-containing protein n=1 Tax=Lysobacter sp. Root916 TaxID=1736606 RepID=UPI0009E6A6F3|nr:DUF4274 domain-containing protein [Lysobacter sp. Root916]